MEDNIEPKVIEIVSEPDMRTGRPAKRLKVASTSRIGFSPQNKHCWPRCRGLHAVVEVRAHRL